MAKRYEGYAADKAEDKRQAKKRGMPLKKYERSGIDKKADAAGQRKLDAKKRKKK
jgi:hypothetical protein